MKLTLRKGTIVEIINIAVYKAKDNFNGNIIFITLSKGQRLQGITLEIGEIIYIIASPLDISKGKLHTEGILRGLRYEGNFTLDKIKLDKGIDPLEGEIS